MVADNEKPLAKISAKSTADPILRNALRYTISAKEYEALHRYVLSRSRIIKRKLPSVTDFEDFVGVREFDESRNGENACDKGTGWLMTRDEYNVATIRESLRVLLATAIGLKLWDIARRILGMGRERLSKNKSKCSHLRQSLSLATILLLHRLLFRFFNRIRAHLLSSAASPFCKRNKITSKALTSYFAAPIGASLSGLALAIYPAESSRVTISIYVLSRALEFAYNLAEENGWIWKNGRPTWWGSWLLCPVSSGQLLLAFVYDRDCFPKAYGEFILKNSPAYIHNRPNDYPPFLPWPSKYEVINNLAAMSKQKYPKFISPILFPESKPNFPSIAPITNAAHPLITQLSCAVLHPLDHSCLRTYLKNWITVFPQLTRFFTFVFSIFALPRILLRLNKPDSILNVPQVVIGRLMDRILRYSVFVSGAIGTSWASVCLFQSIFSRNFLVEKRYFLGGFLGGLWAWIVRRQARSEFMYSMRASILSCWQIGQKRGWWKSFPGGDILVFIVGLATLNVIFECDKGRGVVNSWMVRSVLSGARGYGWNGTAVVKNPEEQQLKYASS
ncbi:hypothetical protein EPUL_000743 [Erysiphe pulchra]|uniref:Transmembrane protein 135 N-terminal domain-containing protein n=1 Tax=Erysiphe pulchra TaxID=225359 RepID=A0A2S4Q0M7_9PEZI|nr:hypothetical protein EPUL_000743 [Erysiphe pulchra]